MGLASPQAAIEIPEPLSFIEPHVRGLLETTTADGVSGVIVVLNGERHFLGGSPDGSKTVIDISVPMVDAQLELYSEGDPKRSEHQIRWQSALLLAAKEQEIQYLASSLVETTDQLVSIYNLSKGSPSSPTADELGRYFAAKITEVIDCDAVLLVDAHGGLHFAGEADLQARMGDCWVEANRTDKLVRGEHNGVRRDGVVINFVECTSGGVVLSTSNHMTTNYRKLVGAVVSYVDGVLALSTLQAVEIQNAILNHDIKMAGLLADQVMPTWEPDVAGIQVAARCTNARLASGDFYSYVQTPYGLLAAVGDVSGKGLSAAVVMAMVSTAVAIASGQVDEADPELILQQVNNELYEYLSNAGVFVTLAVATWDTANARLSVSNAGHSPVYLVSDTVETVAAGGPPLGVLPTCSPGSEAYDFEVDDYLLLGSDGLAEQADPSGVQLGYDRLEALAGYLHGTDAAGAVAALFDAVDEHGQGAPQDDDRTALVVRRVQTP